MGGQEERGTSGSSPRSPQIPENCTTAPSLLSLSFSSAVCRAEKLLPPRVTSSPELFHRVLHRSGGAAMCRAVSPPLALHSLPQPPSALSAVFNCSVCRRTSLLFLDGFCKNQIQFPMQLMPDHVFIQILMAFCSHRVLQHKLELLLARVAEQGSPGSEDGALLKGTQKCFLISSL